MKVVVAGGTGFVGKALVGALRARGDAVVMLARNPGPPAPGQGDVEVRAWDGKSPGEWSSALEGADAVINLAGENVAARRWSAERKLELLRSRLDPTRALVQAIGRAARKPKVLVNASAVGYYGLAPEGTVDEKAAQGRDFLAALCGQWEREAFAAEAHRARVATLRLGVVLGRGGGAYARMRLPFLLFAGGPLGSGRQPFPWVHLDDAVGAMLFVLDRAELAGPLNVVAPECPDNAAFSKALGRSLGRPSWAPVPGLALRLLLGEMSGMLLNGPRVEPRRLKEAGYAFKHPAVGEALESIAI